MGFYSAHSPKECSAVRGWFVARLFGQNGQYQHVQGTVLNDLSKEFCENIINEAKFISPYETPLNIVKNPNISK